MKRRDFTQVAFDVVQQAIGEAPKVKARPKNPEAAEMGRRGGLRGGKARALKLSHKRRSEIAKKAAKKRWQSKS